MKVSYFPGCTLHKNGEDFDKAGRSSASKLGIEFEEVKDWTCCGATFPLAEDYDMALASPSRVLADCEGENDHLVTLCAVCHNVFKRTHALLTTNPERRDKILDFIERDYKGNLKVVHYLELLRDELGFDALAEKVEKPLEGLKVAPYYGCLLLRPHDPMDMDDPNNPTILEDFIRALGGEVVDHPMKSDCCGAFQVLNSPETSERCSNEVADSAKARGAESIVTACPLCRYNLEEGQKAKASGEADIVPVIYFTELLDMALGGDWASMDWSRHGIDPTPLFERAGL